MAGIKSILLHVDATAASVPRFEVALQVAARHEARITALFAAAPDLEHATSTYSAAALLARQEEWGEPARALAMERLRRSVGATGPHVQWCDVVEDSITHGFVAEAAYADLVIVGQPGATPTAAGAAPAGFVESVILESARPTLVVPEAPRSRAVGQRVLLAWDGSVPAARAMTGSLPFLQQAAEVHVVSWSERPQAAPFSRVDVGRYLRNHDIAATLHLRHATPRVAEELALLATSLDADLVVMGCYGHGRMRERIFGGASRGALADMPAPLLMAH